MLALLLLACDTESPEPVRLEAFTAADPRSVDGGETTASGLAAVSGADRDWTLIVGEEPAIAFHVPGGSDLSILDGRDLDVEIGNGWNSDTRNVSIDDEDGAVFLAQHTTGGPVSTAFGSDFLAFGEELSAGELEYDGGTYVVSYREAVVGGVVALPGQPVEVRVDGATWRVVVHASFEVVEYPDTMAACGGGIDTTLSVEMLRVETAPDLAEIAPADGLALAGEYSCGG